MTRPVKNGGSSKGAHRLSRVERQLQGIFESAPVGMALVDSNGMFRTSNAAFQRIVGYSRSELRRMSFGQITYEEDLPENKSLFQELLSGSRDRYLMEKRYLRKDGSIAWANLAVSLVHGVEVPARAIVIVEDITDRKRSEQELQRLALAIDTVPESVIIAGMDGGVLYVNPGAERLFGYSPDEMVGTSVFYLHQRASRETVGKEIFEATIGGGSWSGEAVQQKKSGEEFPARLSTALIAEHSPHKG